MRRLAGASGSDRRKQIRATFAPLDGRRSRVRQLVDNVNPKTRSLRQCCPLAPAPPAPHLPFSLTPLYVSIPFSSLFFFGIIHKSIWHVLGGGGCVPTGRSRAGRRGSRQARRRRWACVPKRRGRAWRKQSDRSPWRTSSRRELAFGAVGLVNSSLRGIGIAAQRRREVVGDRMSADMEQQTAVTRHHAGDRARFTY